MINFKDSIIALSDAAWTYNGDPQDWLAGRDDESTVTRERHHAYTVVRLLALVSDGDWVAVRENLHPDYFLSLLEEDDRRTAIDDLEDEDGYQ